MKDIIEITFYTIFSFAMILRIVQQETTYLVICDNAPAQYVAADSWREDQYTFRCAKTEEERKSTIHGYMFYQDGVVGR